MKVTRKSQYSGIIRTIDIDVTEDQVLLYNDGQTNIQNCFPHLTADQREFILTGITKEEWDIMMSDISLEDL